MPGAVEVIAAFGFQRAPEIVQYATKNSLELAVACTLLEKESNARNVFGHDNVDTGGTYVKGAEVTVAAYKAYLVWRDEPARRQRGWPSRMQGVGPAQLTWFSYQDMADQRGGCWRWEVNVDVGFGIFANHIKNLGDIWQAAKAYNGKAVYADDFMPKLAQWRKRLAPTSEEPTVSNKNSSSRGGTPISLIAVHTNEGPNDSTGSPDPGAENLITWMENNGVSYHVVVDDDSRPRQVTDDRASWSLRTGNARSLNVCFIGRAAFSRAEWLRHDNMLRLGADQVREWCDRYGIPKVKLTAAQVGADQRGVCGHWDWTVGKRDGSHTDPGPNFPWDVFIQLVNGTEEEDMTPEQALMLDIVFDQLTGPGNAKRIKDKQPIVWGWDTKRYLGDGEAQEKLTVVDLLRVQDRESMSRLGLDGRPSEGRETQRGDILNIAAKSSNTTVNPGVAAGSGEAPQ